MQQGIFKRLSVKDHNERVKFDATEVNKVLTQNKFKLIFPAAEPEPKHERFARKAHEIW